MAVDPRVKAAAVADLAAGMSERGVAAKHDIPRSTVQYWARRFKPAQPLPGEVDAKFGELVTELIHLGIVTARTCSDPEWQKQQDGHALAHIVDVVSKQLVSILTRAAEARAGVSVDAIEVEQLDAPTPPGAAERD